VDITDDDRSIDGLDSNGTANTGPIGLNGVCESCEFPLGDVNQRLQTCGDTPTRGHHLSLYPLVSHRPLRGLQHHSG